MKKLILTTVVFLSAIAAAFAQDVKHVTLEQTNGEFTVKELKLSEGKYIFDIANNGVDHEVGFVLAPEGKLEAKDHIKSAYVTKKVGTGETVPTSEVTLTKGTYTYFCPLNPTPQYTLIVE